VQVVASSILWRDLIDGRDNHMCIELRSILLTVFTAKYTRDITRRFVHFLLLRAVLYAFFLLDFFDCISRNLFFE
jgi:hypothetical protein